MTGQDPSNHAVFPGADVETWPAADPQGSIMPDAELVQPATGRSDLAVYEPRPAQPQNRWRQLAERVMNSIGPVFEEGAETLPTYGTDLAVLEADAPDANFEDHTVGRQVEIASLEDELALAEKNAIPGSMDMYFVNPVEREVLADGLNHPGFEFINTLYAATMVHALVSRLGLDTHDFRERAATTLEEIIGGDGAELLARVSDPSVINAYIQHVLLPEAYAVLREEERFKEQQKGGNRASRLALTGLFRNLRSPSSEAAKAGKRLGGLDDELTSISSVYERASQRLDVMLTEIQTETVAELYMETAEETAFGNLAAYLGLDPQVTKKVTGINGQEDAEFIIQGDTALPGTKPGGVSKPPAVDAVRILTESFSGRCENVDNLTTMRVFGIVSGDRHKTPNGGFMVEAYLENKETKAVSVKVRHVTDKAMKALLNRRAENIESEGSMPYFDVLHIIPELVASPIQKDLMPYLRAHWAEMIKEHRRARPTYPEVRLELTMGSHDSADTEAGE